MNPDLPDVQAGFRKGRVTRDQIANIRQIIEKAREFQKNVKMINYNGEWASLGAQLVKNPSAIHETPVWFIQVRKVALKKDRLPTPDFLGFSGASADKESTCNAGDLGLIPGLGRSSGGGHGNSLQHSCLENPHGQRSLVGYSLWSRTVGHDWTTNHSTEWGIVIFLWPSYIFTFHLVIINSK